MLSSIRWLGTRTVIFYVLIFLAGHFMVKHERVAFGLKVRILNSIMSSSFTSLINIIEIGGTTYLEDEESLQAHLRFYQRVIDFFPERADAHGMAGVCYYYLGQKDQAKKFFERAEVLKPDFFWYPYNLGVIHFEAKQYAKANHFFSKAIAIDPNATLAYIRKSKVIFKSIMLDDPKFAKQTVNRLKEGYRQAVQAKDKRRMQLKVQMF